MRILFAIVLAGTVLTVAPPQAQAGVYSDDLAKCLVKNTTAADQRLLVSWIFAAISTHPELKAQSNLNDRQRESASRGAAALLQRLMIVDCRQETVAGVKYEGQSAIERAFSVLGQVAMRSVMEEPSVTKGVGQIGEFVDAAKFEALMTEAGESEPK